MKLKFILTKKTEVDTPKGASFSFLYVPTLEEYKNKIKLVVTCKDPYALNEKLELPQSINDTLILEMIRKEAQVKLDEPKKNKSNIPDTASWTDSGDKVVK
jgi:hypothetical protein